MTDSDDQGAKLDLARAYIDMGDYAGAREILRELEQRGNSEAIRLLQTLPTNDYVLSKKQLALNAMATSQPATPISVPDKTAPENKGTRTKKIHIGMDIEYFGGLILEGQEKQERKGALITYSIVDGESGRRLTEQEFGSYEAAEAYIATNYPGCERWTPPPPSAEELAEFMRRVNFLEIRMERDPPEVFSTGASDRDNWAELTYELHQRSHDSNTVARIKALLARVDPRIVAAWILITQPA